MKNIRIIQELHELGITGYREVSYNPSYEELYQAEMSEKNKGYEKGVVTESGAVAVKTGIFTGRSPKDRYIVLDDVTRDTINWDGKVNFPTTPEIFKSCKERVLEQLASSNKLYVVDAFCGTNPDTRLKVRFVMEVAWQAHFVTNMFIRPSNYELENFGKPDFIVMNGSKTTNPDWKEQGLNSENFVMFNLTERIQIIGGTWYGGEMKKGMFAMMNYYLPLKGMASMHCSANVGEEGDVALFFGLSGTGKTTLSADPKRYLIGDDEHGWDDNGVFNYEGGCYAKVIDLTEEKEPDIFRAIKRDALLENVVENDNVKPITKTAQLPKTRVFLIRSITSIKLCSLQRPVTLKKSFTYPLMRSVYCRRFQCWMMIRHSTTSFAVILPNLPVPKEVSPSRNLHSPRHLVRLSLPFTQRCILKR